VDGGARFAAVVSRISLPLRPLLAIDDKSKWDGSANLEVLSVVEKQNRLKLSPLYRDGDLLGRADRRGYPHSFGGIVSW